MTPAAETWLLDGAHLLSMDPAHPDGIGSLLVDGDGVILAVGDIDADARATAAHTVDATGFIVLPGFVDTHRHTWQTSLRHMAVGWDLASYIENLQMLIAASFTPDDVYVGNLLGAITALDAGITTLRDEAHIMNTPEHADAAIAALRDSGIRARFDYGWPSVEAEKWMFDSQELHPVDIRRVREDVLADDDALVTLNAHLRGPEMTNVQITARDIAFMRDLGIRSSMHMGNGEFGLRNPGIRQLHEAGLLGPDLSFVHCCTSTDEELRAAAAAGSTVSVCAWIESVMPGLGIPATARCVAAGVRPSFGVDVEVAANGDMFTVLRAALQSRQVIEIHDPKAMEPYPSLSPRDLVEFATIEGARTCGLDAVTGSLAPGKRADLIAIDGRAAHLAPLGADPYGAIVAAATAADVKHVWVAGRQVKRDGALIGIDAPSVAERARASRERLLPTELRSGASVRARTA
jgi:cytosine/adenosine deaminase-related metal-dependent hydrolase